MLKRLRLRLVYLLMGRKVKEVTIRALVQGSDTWFECVTDEAMQHHEDDIAVTKAVRKDLDVLSDFWTI